MNTTTARFTRAERNFRFWIAVNCAAYALGAPLFLLLGRQIAAFLNGLPDSLTRLPPWPAAGQGMEPVFWQILGVSLMVMLALLCRMILRDQRRYAPMAVALMGAKLASTVCYLTLFLIDGNPAFLIATLTDGVIFLVTLVLWYAAAPGENAVDASEMRILAAAGEALLPEGGPFAQGYRDRQEYCLAQAGSLIEAQGSMMKTLTRLMLRCLDVLPLFMGYRGTLCRLSATDRAAAIERLELSRISPIRMMAIALKVYVVAPFFNAPERAADLSPAESPESAECVQ